MGSLALRWHEGATRMLVAMSSDDTVRSSTSVARATRFRRGAVVVLVAFGLLSMHGLTAGAASSEAEHHGRNTAMISDAAMVTPGDGTHAMGGADGGHDALHAIGQACLWLIVGGVLLFSLRHFAIRLAAVERWDDADRLEPPRWSTLHHPPDPRFATVALRC